VFLKIYRQSDGYLIASRARLADGFFQRFRGLMLSPPLKEGEGLLLVPCNQIHMMFMRFPIDAVFLSNQNEVVTVYHSLTPWFGFSKWHREAEKVLEIPAGLAKKMKLQNGDRLSIENLTK